jgi:hypothetical protein
MEWQEISGGWVYLPQQEIIGVIHFLGGAFVATAPQISYRSFLEKIGQAGFAIVATPFLNTFDHLTIAREVLNRFETILHRLQTTKQFTGYALPIYGIGHSMGCKLHLIIGSLYEIKRAGNILISYNNYPASRAIPFVEQFEQFNNVPAAFNIEFVPSPLETNKLIARKYQVRRNLLIKFDRDNLDQTIDLNPILSSSFPQMVTCLKLPGTHLTPLNQHLKWQIGDNFTPLDAIGQWIDRNISGDLYRLQREIKLWLNPTIDYVKLTNN